MSARRRFLLATAALPLLHAAPHHVNARAEPDATFAAVLDLLWPESPGVPAWPTFNALPYLNAVLNDERIDPSLRYSLIEGADWLNETCEDFYGAPFVKLAAPVRETAFATILLEPWGEAWVATLYGYLFEALLADPVYGGNTDACGWRWLQHTPGQPRPDTPA